MDEVLLLKFTQHPDLKAELLDTDNAELIEVTGIRLLHSCVLILLYAELR